MEQVVTTPRPLGEKSIQSDASTLIPDDFIMFWVTSLEDIEQKELIFH